MDTHMPHLEMEPSVGRSARLPDEPDLDTSGPVEASHRSAPNTEAYVDQSVPARPRKRRGRLLSGVGLGALIVASAGVFLLSPFNTVVPVPPEIRKAVQAAFPYAAGAVDQARQAVVHQWQEVQHAAEPGAQGTAMERPQTSPPADPVVAPAASLAATRLPARTGSVTAPLYEAQPREQSLSEVLSLGAVKPNAVVAPPSEKPQFPAASARTPTKAQVAPPAQTADLTGIQEPGAAAMAAAAPLTPARADITSAVTQAALGSASATVSKPTDSVPTASPPDDGAAKPQVAAIVVAPREPPAAPVSVSAPSGATGGRLNTAADVPTTLVLSVPPGHQEQAEVLQYVTGLTGEIARLRMENETLRKDVGRRMAEQDGRLADFNRRVSIAEARSALKQVADAGRSDDAPSASGPRLLQQVSNTPAAALPPNDARAAVNVGNRLRYRVQAASPGLALLAEVGRGGGEGAQLQVAVGDQIPGYGVVKSVSQRGPNWVVQTERGAID